MAWLRIDDQFAEHPKVVRLSDRAFRLHTAALCYCARNLTDGHLDRRAVNVIQAILDKPIKQAIGELVTGKLWIDRTDGCFEIHGFLERNPPAEDVKAERANNAERQRRWREKHATESNDERNATDNETRNALRTGLVTVPVTGAPSRPVPLQELNPKAVKGPGAETASDHTHIKNQITTSLEEANG